MAGEHYLEDDDFQFVIDQDTREIIYEGDDPFILTQTDHNSEKLTFLMPRYIEGHDMLGCNQVEVHYINIATGGKRKEANVYTVEGVEQAFEADMIKFTWTITQNATQHAGILTFAVRFACVGNPGSGDSTIYYSWRTKPYAGITIAETIDNASTIVEEYSDEIQTWYANILAASNNGVKAIQDEAEAQIERVKREAVAEIEQESLDKIEAAGDKAISDMEVYGTSAINNITTAGDEQVARVADAFPTGNIRDGEGFKAVIFNSSDPNEDDCNKAKATHSTAAGWNNTIEETGWLGFIAGGGTNLVTSHCGFAANDRNQTWGESGASFGIGNKNYATGGFMRGHNNTLGSEASYSDVGGEDNWIEGAYCHAGGCRNWMELREIEQGDGSIKYQKADFSHIEGTDHSIFADAVCCHLEGQGHEARAKYVHIEGWCNIADGYAQNICGRFSSPDSNQVVIVGWGTPPNKDKGTEEIRKNIYTLDTRGNARFGGGISVNVNDPQKQVTINTFTKLGAVNGWFYKAVYDLSSMIVDVTINGFIGEDDEGDLYIADDDTTVETYCMNIGHPFGTNRIRFIKPDSYTSYFKNYNTFVGGGVSTINSVSVYGVDGSSIHILRDDGQTRFPMYEYHGMFKFEFVN